MVDFFSELPFYRCLAVTTRTQLSHACMKSQYEARAIVFRKGEIARGMYVLQSGKAELKIGNERQMIEPGMPLGGAALFFETTEIGSLVITQPAQVWLLTRENFQEILQAAEPTESKAVQACSQWYYKRYAAKAFDFPGQRPDEKVLLIRRRHLWALCRKLWLPSLTLAFAFGIGIWMSFIPSTLLLMVACSILAVLMLLYQFVEWWNDLLIMSNQRVIHIVRTIKSLQSFVSETALRNIQQVSADFPRGDPLARLLNYGTLELRTTGDAGSILIRDMNEPRKLQQEIMAFCSLTASENEISRIERDEDTHWQLEIATLVGEERREEQQTSLNIDGSFPEKFEDRIYRKHLWVWLAHIWLGALIFLAGLALLFLWPLWPPLQSLGGIGIAMSTCIMVIGGLWIYLMDWDWRHDLLILGEKTIIMHHRRPLWLQSERDEILLERVDNVTSSSIGILQTIWNYGEIRLALMGDDSGDVKRFVGVPKPQRVQDEISIRREQLQKTMQLNAREAQKADMAEILSEIRSNNEIVPNSGDEQNPHRQENGLEYSSVVEPLYEIRPEDLPQPPPKRPKTSPED